MVGHKLVDHVQFVVVFVVVLFALLGFEEIKVIVFTVASSSDSFFQVLKSLLRGVHEDAFCEGSVHSFNCIFGLLLLDQVRFPRRVSGLVVH